MQYNDNSHFDRLFSSINKILNDSVYNEKSKVINTQRIADSISKNIEAECESDTYDYYAELFNADSPMNKHWYNKNDFDNRHFLKLTFAANEKEYAKKFYDMVKSMNFVKCGYYDRFSGEQTIVASISKKCTDKTKIAFKLMKKTISILREIRDIKPCDKRYLLCTKYFLEYLFKEHPVRIIPTIDNERCVICTKGEKSRIAEIEKMLKTSNANVDTKHETEFLKSCLERETIGDTTISIPASIVVYQMEKPTSQLCEFDGFAIFPMRKEEQIMFCEAKNRKDKAERGKHDLIEKFEKLGINITQEEIKVIGKDAMVKMSI